MSKSEHELPCTCFLHTYTQDEFFFAHMDAFFLYHNVRNVSCVRIALAYTSSYVMYNHEHAYAQHAYVHTRLTYTPCMHIDA